MTATHIASVYCVSAGTLTTFNAGMLLTQYISSAPASSYAFGNPVIGLIFGAWLGHEVVSAGE